MSSPSEDFVDFYGLLEVEPGADDGLLRGRIAALYLEARENLEHKSHRKRFYYRELYEIQLPQARHTLLNKPRREAYDAKLKKYRAERPDYRPPVKPQDDTVFDASGLPGASTSTSEADLAALFADFADTDDEPETAAQPVKSAPKRVQFDMDPEQVEKRRDVKRRELIKQELINTGLKWGIGAGLATLLVCAGLVVAIKTVFEDSSFILIIGGGLVSLALCALAARQMTRWSRRRIIAKLSVMPYPELLLHCAGK